MRMRRINWAARRRQKLHLLAMEEEAHVEIILGSCRKRRLVCPNCKAGMKCLIQDVVATSD
jgi:hypothetical protein